MLLDLSGIGDGHGQAGDGPRRNGSTQHTNKNSDSGHDFCNSFVFWRSSRNVISSHKVFLNIRNGRFKVISLYGCSWDKCLFGDFTERLSKNLCLDDDVVVSIWRWLNIVVNDERYFKEQLIFLIIHLSLHQIPTAHPPVFNAYLSVESSHRCHIAFYWSPRVLCSPLIGHREIDDQSMELSV